ncbi:nicotinamide riboside transporter PnuC [Flavobacterium branchiophilum]|uniref:Nicotinamide riboside transporter PnuC n=2 Tax=Flavobacterium branchiophilum TaxID=55197 RepID=G2Z4G7_FLABF|nr:nicotinamide riboside transporter PnuC [Flavobacterium branchiophilum]PDS24483.1 nicotinamide riboside transporter PnuC [Flavobacterium branchiophilum]CCB68442.1 Nicotinamide mononucleotide transporter PnuC [Flavobacterium branchiophilum FL-15]
MLDFWFAQYKNETFLEILLEITAALLGLASVWFSKKNNILVFPTGLVNTAIYAYLFWKWSLLGDSMINVYYFVMSLYGWYLWQQKSNQADLPVTMMDKSDRQKAVLLFLGALVFVITVYIFVHKLTNWMSYVDTLITGLFFVGMWLMAKKKIENWLFWIVGDIISVPLYFIKGYTVTSLQYFIFTIIAFYGFLEWKKILNKTNPIS